MYLIDSAQWVESIFGSFSYSLISSDDFHSFNHCKFWKNLVELLLHEKFKHNFKNTLNQRNKNCGMDNEFYIFSFGKLNKDDEICIAYLNLNTCNLKDY